MLYVSLGNAQVYKGVLITEQKGVPVEYANVGIIGKNVGTTSNMYGQFELKIPTEYLRDSIRFSMIGYKPITLLVSDFINRNNDTLLMKEKIYPINEVVITPIGKSVILGNRKVKVKKGLLEAEVVLGSCKIEKGFELGITLDPKRKKTLLEKISLYVAFEFTILENGVPVSCKSLNQNTILYRLNLYNIKSKNDFENFLIQPIYLKSKVNNNNSFVLLEFDISEYQIVIENESLLTLEYFTDVSAAMGIASSFKGSASYIRKTSQGDWKNMNTSLGVTVKAKIMN